MASGSPRSSTVGLASVIEGSRCSHGESDRTVKRSGIRTMTYPTQRPFQDHIWLCVKSCEMSLALRQFHQTRDIDTVMNFLSHRNQACYESTKEESELGGKCMSPLIDDRWLSKGWYTSGGISSRQHPRLSCHAVKNTRPPSQLNSRKSSDLPLSCSCIYLPPFDCAPLRTLPRWNVPIVASAPVAVSSMHEEPPLSRPA